MVKYHTGINNTKDLGGLLLPGVTFRSSRPGPFLRRYEA